MSANDLEARLDAMEMRIAYQDDTIEALNKTVALQWQDIDKLKRQIATLTEQLREAEAKTTGPSPNERPPHY